jgi:hypothetical protein
LLHVGIRFKVLKVIAQIDSGSPKVFGLLYEFISWKPVHLKSPISFNHPTLLIKPIRCTGFHHAKKTVFLLPLPLPSPSFLPLLQLVDCCLFPPPIAVTTIVFVAPTAAIVASITVTISPLLLLLLQHHQSPFL